MISRWLEWARASHPGSFPGGCEYLELGPDYYDAHVPTGDWRTSTALEVVYLPAAVYCAIAGGPVLDIGCGPGIFAELLVEMGIEYELGLDTSEACVRATRQRGFAATLFEWPAKRHIPHVTYAGCVALLEVLEHVYRDLELVAAIPGGMGVVISVPSSMSVGHVRWFGSLAEAQARYAHLIEWRDGMTTYARKSDNRWFVMRGVRR